MPEMYAVESAAIEAAGYDAEARELYLRFRESHETYVYWPVPPEVYGEFLVAESKGTYLNREIKPRFEYRRAP
jgi:hypothetical protein